MSVTSEQRQFVWERARNCCEYCRVAETGRLSRFHVDHIIAIKHGGTDEVNNLCLACYKCNGYKGSNIAAVDPETGQASKPFNPRLQIWDEHFTINPDATLTGLTPEGRTTLTVLKINEEERVRTRQLALLSSDYPCNND